MKSRLVIILYGLIACFITLNRGVWREERVISWDGTGYYMYLPAFFIYHDPGQLGFYTHIDSLYQPSGAALQYGIHDHPATGRRSIRYPAGVALLEAPGFAIAHFITKHFTDYPADGYSAPYQLAVALSTILWALIGLLLLRRFLLHLYPEAVVWKVLLFLALGTNFYYYTAFFQGWSHAYSFFLFAAVLYLTLRWHQTGAARPLLLLGMVIGLAVITRPTNILIAVIPLLWPAGGFQRKIAFFRTQLPGLLFAALLFIAVLMVQLGYWKYATGQWVYYSYTDEGFDFLHPKLWKGLFSYRKGWFVYTPLAVLCLLGFAPLFKKNKALFLPIAAFTMLQVYVVFSWKIWHYGGCFSCRPMVEALAVLSVPACALTAYIGTVRSRVWPALTTAIAGILLLLNIFQTYQYSLGIIHFDRMTRAYYWRVFGRLHVTDEDRQLLRPASEDEPDQ